MPSLREYFGSKGERRGRQWALMLLSLCIALLIWTVGKLSMEYSWTLSVPVTAHCNLDGHRIRSSNTVVVSARCRIGGARILLRRFGRRRRPAVVHFRRADMHQDAPDRFHVAGGAVHSYADQFFGEGTKVEAFITDTLRFVFPEELHKKVAVSVPMSLTFLPQYMQSAPFKVTPDSVLVYADAERLESIDQVSTERLVLFDLRESRHGAIRLTHPRGVRLSHEEVRYSIPVSRYVELRGRFPVEVWNVPAGHTVQVYPPSAEVVLHCEFPIVRDPIPSFKLYIDYRDFATSLSGRCVAKTLRLPPGVLKCQVQPEVFECMEIQ